MQWIARAKNGLKLTPTTRYMPYSNQITDSDTESDEEGDFEVVYSRTFMTSHVGNEDQYVTAASGSMRAMKRS